MALTEQGLLAALASVQDPHTGKDFVAARAVRNVQISGGDVAFDVALTVGLRRHAFFEANAFGDLIRRVLHRGLDPYDWQVACLPAWIAARHPSRLAA